VSQPDLAYGLWSPEEPSQADYSALGANNLALSLPLPDYQALLDEIAQAQALEHERVARIYDLEQALDQALACLDDLKLQIHDQEFLEAQLATTEEFAYVQQQAIARLKLQLTQQRQALEAQAAETQERDQAVQALLAMTETMAQAQQGELERLRSRIAQDQIAVQTHRTVLEKQLRELQTALESRQQRILELESESLVSRSLTASLEVQLDAAQQQIHQLCTSLSQHQTSLANLEAQLAQAQAALTVPPVAVVASSSTADAANQSTLPRSDLQQELAMAQIKVEELETQLAKQLTLQARWQHNCQELEAERDRSQARVEALEQEAAEMQEQILQQARAASEYETAVQHWKDRYLASQRQLAQLKELLERTLPQHLSEPDGQLMLFPALSELLVAVQNLLAPEASEPNPLPAPRFQSLDLPEFLVRRRNYRAK